MTDGFKDHFSRRSADYAASRPGYPTALVNWLAGVAPARSLAWDAACGSGQLSTLLGVYFDRVVATDASSSQIAEARAHPQVEYRVERAESTSLAGGSVDLITVAQAAHWLALEEFYGEVRRVARPGGVVALVAYGLTQVNPAVDALVGDFYWGDLAGHWPPERKHIEEGYRDLPFPFERFEQPTFDMTVEWSPEQMVAYVRTWSAVKALETAEGAARFDRFAADLRATWGEVTRQVRWPLTILCGRVSNG